MALYDYHQVDALIDRYISKGGEALQVNEGTLGRGDWFLFDHSGNLKFIIIREVYLNEWSSAHKIRMYNKMPKKYKREIERLQDLN